MVEEKAELIPLNSFADNRGVLKKVLLLSQLDWGRIEEAYLLYSNPGSVRGNHYHLGTLEYFAVVSGTARIILRGMETGKGEEITLSAQDNLVLKVPPGVAHAFKNETDEDLIILAISTREYDNLNPDTFPVELV